MKTITTKLTIFLVVFLTTYSYSQEALWQLDFEKEVEWTKITDSGILLAGASDMTLFGIDSRDGNVLWENNIMRGAKGIKGADGKKQEQSALFDQYLRVLEDPNVPELSDYVEIKYTDNISFKNYAIINIHTGEEVISPRKADMPVTKFFGKEMPTFNYNGTGFISDLNAVIISAEWQDMAAKGKPEYSLTKFVELPSGKILWESDKIAVNALPIVGFDGNLIMGGKRKIAKMDSKTGNIMWLFETTEKKQTFEGLDVSLDLTTGYFFEKVKNSGQLTALDLGTGNKYWTNDIKLKTVPQMFSMSYGVVVVDEKFFTLYDSNTGEVKWQTKKATGIVVDLGDKGIAVGARGKRLLLLNKTDGSIIWDEKVKGIGIDKIVAKGIMYTDEKGRLGIITYDGEKVWEGKGMLPVPSIRYQPSFGIELMYADGTLYEVDLQEGTYKVLQSKIDKGFKDDQVPEFLELQEGGYLMSSSNNLLMLEPDGNIRWQKHWKAPGMSLAAKIALRTLQAASYAAAAANAAASSASRGRYQNSYLTYETVQSKMYAEQAAAWAAAGTAAGAEARKKFTATKTKGNFLIILTLVGEGGQKNASGLLKVDKRTGEEVASIVLGDKEPIYDYDPVSGQVFFKSSKKQIISYSMD